MGIARYFRSRSVPILYWDRHGMFVLMLFLFQCGIADKSLAQQRRARSTRDSAGITDKDVAAAEKMAELARQAENEAAVWSSGVWNMDGEYRGSNSVYYKLTGYFAYVASTSTSRDHGDEAVMAMYLEPMAGGSSSWISARLRCWRAPETGGLRCLAVEGAKAVLDLNISIKPIPLRGNKTEAELTEPEDKTPEKRWESRASSRGKFTLTPPS